MSDLNPPFEITSLPRLWRSTHFRNDGPADPYDYGHPLDELPEVPISLDGLLSWLDSPVRKDTATIDGMREAYHAKNARLTALGQFCTNEGFQLPAAFTKLFADDTILRIQPGNAEAWFWLPEEPLFNHNRTKALIAFHGSCCCDYWNFLHLDRLTGNEAVVTSFLSWDDPDMLVGCAEVMEDAEGLPDPLNCISADSFEEFLYRFWVESEIQNHAWNLHAHRVENAAKPPDLTAYQLRYESALKRNA